MAFRVGVGVVTYNRRDILAETLAHVRRHTSPYCDLVVADDGSTDGSLDTLRALGVPYVTGRNMGVAWNKNRALYFLHAMRKCDVVILLEDDTFPIRDGWEADWVEAARRWGHANIAGDWFAGSFLGGTGTVEDPVLSTDVSAQCSSYSAESLSFGGYMDTRFRGYGFEHVEHSLRLMRIGYGGEYRMVAGERRAVHKLIRGGVLPTTPPSHGTQAEIDRNREVCHAIMWEQLFRAAWRSDEELEQFRSEMMAGVARAG